MADGAQNCLLLTYFPSVLLISSMPGKCALRMKIADDTASMERRRFRIKVEAAGRQDIEPALTEKLTVM